MNSRPLVFHPSCFACADSGPYYFVWAVTMLIATVTILVANRLLPIDLHSDSSGIKTPFGSSGGLRLSMHYREARLCSVYAFYLHGTAMGLAFGHGVAVFLFGRYSVIGSH